MSISNPASSFIGQAELTSKKSGRVAGHERGATLVVIFAALLTQLVAALTTLVMWYSWQDNATLAWPDNDRVILMAATLLTVLLVSYMLAARFWGKKAAYRSNFTQTWYSSAAIAGTWFGLPLYLSVTWDHLIYGGHDAFTIISVGAMFMGVGGVAGLLLAAPTEPLAYWLYNWGQKQGALAEERSGRRGKKWGWRLLAFTFAPLILILGGLILFGLLRLTGPAPVADATYQNAVLLSETQAGGDCYYNIKTYYSSDAPSTVFAYYQNLANGHKFIQFAAPGQLDRVAFGPLAEKLQISSQAASVRYSNTPFQSNGSVSAYSPYKVNGESCRSTRLLTQPDTNAAGTLIQLITERPGHVH